MDHGLCIDTVLLVPVAADVLSVALYLLMLPRLFAVLQRPGLLNRWRRWLLFCCRRPIMCGIASAGARGRGEGGQGRQGCRAGRCCQGGHGFVGSSQCQEGGGPPAC